MSKKNLCYDVEHCLSKLVGYSLLVVFYQCSIKIHDLSELKEVYTIVNVEEEKGM